MNDLIIYGAGSIGRLFVQIATDINKEEKNWNILGFLDDDESKWGTSIGGVPVLGGAESLKQHTQVHLLLGFSSPALKRRLVERLSHFSVQYPALVHPRAWLGARVDLGEGTVLYPGVCIDVDVTVGKHVLINKNSTIGHDTRIGDYVSLAPGVNLGGAVEIGEGCDFGINSSTIQNLSVGRGAVIGAGACVVRDIPENCTAVGVPAKPVKFHHE